MTVRAKKPTDKEPEGILEVVDRTLGTKSFRAVVFFLLLSMHPVGRSLLGVAGFEFPDERKLTLAADVAKNAKTELEQISEDVKELKSDMTTMRATNAILGSKVDALASTVTGFQVDFNKYKTTAPQ